MLELLGKEWLNYVFELSDSGSEDQYLLGAVKSHLFSTDFSAMEYSIYK